MHKCCLHKNQVVLTIWPLYSYEPPFYNLRLIIQDLDKALVGEMTILSIDETEQATASKDGSGKELTKLTFKVPPPPKPVDLEKRKYKYIWHVR